MKRRLLLAAGLLACVATSRGETVLVSPDDRPDTGNLGCDDAWPALCVTATLGDEVVVPDSLELQDAEQTVVAEMTGEECTWEPPTGSYVVVGSYEGETVAEPVLVENSFACSHETAEVELVFGAEE